MDVCGGISTEIERKTASAPIQACWQA